MTETLQDSDSYILFELANTTYAVQSRDVQHMEMVEHITPVPNAPPHVEGVVFSRGQVVPAINLRLRFGFARAPYTLRSRLIVVQVGQRRVGLIVDAAREFRKVTAEEIQPPHESITGLSGQYLAGIANIGDRVILLLNIPEVIKGGVEVPAADLALAEGVK